MATTRLHCDHRSRRTCGDGCTGSRSSIVDVAGHVHGVDLFTASSAKAFTSPAKKLSLIGEARRSGRHQIKVRPSSGGSRICLGLGPNFSEKKAKTYIIYISVLHIEKYSIFSIISHFNFLYIDFTTTPYSY